MPWPADWDTRFSGLRCGLCAEGRPSDPPRGPRIFEGRYSDGYLRSSGVQRGWAVVIWRGRHVVEPHELSEEEASGFWREVRFVGSAMQAHYQPLKMNWQFLGNRDPHLHAILAARFHDDPFPGEPIPAVKGSPFPADEIARDAEGLRRLLRP